MTPEEYEILFGEMPPEVPRIAMATTTATPVIDSFSFERSWWQKKRYLLLIPLFIMFGALSSVLARDAQPKDLAVGNAGAENVAVENVAVEVAGTVEERVASTTEASAPSTTNEAKQPTISAPTTTTSSTTTSSTATSSTATSTTSESPLTIETVRWECGGELVDLPVTENDDPATVCSSSLRLSWIETLTNSLPNIADHARSTVRGWESLELAGRAICPSFAQARNDDELVANLLALWDSDGNSAGASMRTIFGDDRGQFLRFSGTSASAFCPEEFQRFTR